jgi:hypothetical protein
MRKKRSRGKGGRFVSKKRRRSSKRRRRRTASVVVASNPRRRRRRATRTRRRSSRRRRSIYAIPRTNPRRRRRSIRRRRRNPSGGGLSGGQIALATVVGATSFAGATILVPRLLPQQIQSSPVLYGIGMIILGAGFMLLLRKYPVVALAGGVPVTGAGLFLAGTGWLAKSAQPAAQQTQGSNLGAVYLEDVRRGGMGAVYGVTPRMTAPQLRLVGGGGSMGAVFTNGSMGSVEAMVGDGRWSRFRSPSVAQGMGAY